MNLTRSQLATVATELNEQLGIEPPIDTELARAELKSKVRDASALVTPADKLSAETRKVVDFFQSEGDSDNGADDEAPATAAAANGAAETEEAPKPKKAAKPAKEKGATPNMRHEGSMAQYIDALVQKTTDPDKIKQMLAAEAEKRGIKVPTLGSVRAHVKFRQSKGHLQGIEIPNSAE